MPRFLLLALLLAGCGSEQSISGQSAPASGQTLIRSAEMNFRSSVPGFTDHAPVTLTEVAGGTQFATDFQSPAAAAGIEHLSSGRRFQDLEVVELADGRAFSRRSLAGTTLTSLELGPSGVVGLLSAGAGNSVARREGDATGSEGQVAGRAIYLVPTGTSAFANGQPHPAGLTPKAMTTYAVAMKAGSSPTVTLRFPVGGSLGLLNDLQSQSYQGYIITEPSSAGVGSEEFLYYVGLDALTVASQSSEPSGDTVVLRTSYLDFYSLSTYMNTPPGVLQVWFPSQPASF